MRKLFVFLGLLGLLVFPRVILADDAASNDWATATGLKATADGAFGAGYTGGQGGLITYFIGNNIIKPVFGIVGVLFFALTVYAGVLWMTAHGEPKQVDKAKDILISSVIGIVIIVSAYVLTNAIFNALIYGNVNG
ncbi:MAG: hypothetical protein WCT28_00725 [Patescibacteria group bacterium]|jgi:uncharacterized membrane protein